MSFPEDRFPASGIEYAERVRSGYGVMQRLQCTICMLARDCERHLPRTFMMIENTARAFQECCVCVVENDSKDATAEMLTHQSARSSIQVLLETSRIGARKWGTIRSGKRGNDMARYRNQCRSLALNGGRQADCVLVVDSDLAGWSLDGIAHSFSFWGQWDVMASSGLRKEHGKWVQVDAWALRLDTWRQLFFQQVKRMVPERGAPLWRVRSGFGGLCLYSIAAYRSAEYGGGDCEHVVFHRRLAAAGYDRAFVNPSQIVVYRW